jgi:hypothetical protein
MMILRYRRREQGEPENINELFGEVVQQSPLSSLKREEHGSAHLVHVCPPPQNLDMGDIEYGDDGDEYDPDEEDVVEIELSDDDDNNMEGEGEGGDDGGMQRDSSSESDSDE